MNKPKNPHAVALGRAGGKVKSEAKAQAVRENGKKGGRPKRLPDPATVTTSIIAAVIAHGPEAIQTIIKAESIPITDHAAYVAEKQAAYKALRDSVVEPINLGGAQSALPPEQQAISKSNNSRDAWAGKGFKIPS